MEVLRSGKFVAKDVRSESGDGDVVGCFRKAGEAGTPDPAG